MCQLETRDLVGEAPFEVRTRKDPSRTWVTPIGELDLTGSESFDQRLWEAQSGSPQVVLDLRALQFIDSTGLRCIIGARLRSIEWHHHLEVICGDGQVGRMLSICGHGDLIQAVAPLSVSSGDR